MKSPRLKVLIACRAALTFELTWLTQVRWSEGLGGRLLCIEVIANWLVFDNDLISDVEHLVEPWMRQSFRTTERTPDERGISPGGALSINNAYLILSIRCAQLESECNALVGR